jgi:hypothetical protein
MRPYTYLFAVYLFLNLLMLCGCAEKDKAAAEKEMEKAGSSIQKAYEKTTDVIRNAVEDVNDAVYN